MVVGLEVIPVQGIEEALVAVPVSAPMKDGAVMLPSLSMDTFTEPLFWIEMSFAPAVERAGPVKTCWTAEPLSTTVEVVVPLKVSPFLTTKSFVLAI